MCINEELAEIHLSIQRGAEHSDEISASNLRLVALL